MKKPKGLFFKWKAAIGEIAFNDVATALYLQPPNQWLSLIENNEPVIVFLLLHIFLFPWFQTLLAVATGLINEK